MYSHTIFRERQQDLVEVGNGVDVDAFSPQVDGAPIRARYGLGSDDCLLLFVSSLDRSHARKGLHTLLKALAQLPDRRCGLVVVGDGDMRGAYEQQARELGLAGRVHFAGRVPQRELPAHYAACDMVVIPSRPPEAFGVALAQGMAAGKPVIGSDIAGVRTLVEDGASGFLVPPGDARSVAERIAQLAGDAPLRTRMGAQGRRRIVERYTWRRAGARLLDLYEQVLH
jgi:glycosyltransferase involved in cell wall biosynthesis